jgi:outer membrane protein W
MSTKLKRFCRAVSLLSLGLILTLGAAAPAGAAAKHKKGSKHRAGHRHTVEAKGPCKSKNVLHHLGVYKPSRLYPNAPLDSAAKLKKAFAEPSFQEAVQRVLDDEKLGAVAPGLFSAVSSLPDDAQPKDIDPGTKLDWMGYRRHGRPTVMSDVCWAGERPFKKPFLGWVFSVPGGPDGSVDFIVPVPCGNLSRILPPTCVLQKEENGDIVTLDLTGSTPGGAPIASYHSDPELPQSSRGRFQVSKQKCEPGAKCTGVNEELWVEDGLGFRSAPGQCPAYKVPGYEYPPICKLNVTFANNNFHVDATGSGVKVQSFTVTGKSDDTGDTVTGTVPPTTWMTDIPYTPVKSGNWTFTGDEVGENGKHADPQYCYSKVLVCAKPTAVLKSVYDCSTRRLSIDAAGSSVHQVVKVTPGGGDPLSGSGPIYDIKHSGTYTVDLTADDGVCPDNKATATATVTVPPFGDTDRWTLRVFGAYARASSDAAENLNSAATDYRQKINLGAHHGGFGAGFEYRWLQDCHLKPWGIAVDAISTQLDTHILVDRSASWGREEDKVNFTPVLLSLNYHVTAPSQPVDFFLGPSIGYAFLDSVTFNTLGSSYTEKFDDDLTYGINLGIDVPFGPEHQYAFTAGLRQLFFKAKGSGTIDHNFDLNPTIATAGFAFRFR